MTTELNQLAEVLDGAVRGILSERETLPEVTEIANSYKTMLPTIASLCGIKVSDEEADSLIADLVEQYQRDLSYSRRVGFSYEDSETKPWVRQKADEIDWFYWNRYKQYLLSDKHWAPRVVQSLDSDTLRILDLVNDPSSSQPFERRGLVMASVQSGKTSNYAGLICRAADAGYKIIIVMAGVHNVLRNQTQSRLEEGFTGFDITEERKPVGVGKRRRSKEPIVCTSRKADFNKGKVETLLGLQPKNTNAPWLFVIKKNSSALRGVYEWLVSGDGIEDYPLLLIDDEADNASINGKYIAEKRTDEVTKINGQIRKILNFFKKKAYVGYTATPFANILIDPDIELDEYGKDLFPKSFIYTLEESTDYFGARQVFSDYDSSRPKHLRFIDDNQILLPAKHKSDFQVDELPYSLKNAIQTYILATAIRYLRGDEEEHSTMMVNVSPYTAVQSNVYHLINAYVNDLRDSAKSFSYLSPDIALNSSPHLKEMRQAWEYEYGKLGELEWEDVQKKLYDVLKTVHVEIVNSKSGGLLDYEHQIEHVIAIGGYRLSRGLTLEGLVVSYYSRNAKAYDALMQMARWFGYRFGYEDLCRIWMSDEAAGWYKYVADATESLIDQLRSMRQQGRTPRDFGLRIRQHPDSLTVTARNKLGKSQVAMQIDYNNSFIETVALLRDQASIESNNRTTEKLVDGIIESGCVFLDPSFGAGKIAFNVPVEVVQSFLRGYKNANDDSVASNPDTLIDYIGKREDDGELKHWDVMFASGNSDTSPYRLNDSLEVKRERRKPGSASTESILFIGEKRRVSSRGVSKAGMTTEQIERAESNYAADHDSSKNCSDRYYNAERDKPLLVVHPLLLMYDQTSGRGTYENSGIGKSVWPSELHHENAIGFTIAFPYSNSTNTPIPYVLNEIAIQELAKGFADEDTDDGDWGDYDD